MAVNCTTALVTTESGSGTRNDPMAILWQHERHVLVFTRAGKPVFSQHGGEEQLSPLCALLQVLLHIQEGEEGGSEQRGRLSQSAPRSDGAAFSVSVKDEVRQVIYYQSRPTPGQISHQGDVSGQVQALTFFFYVQGELMYVMAVRSVDSSPSAGTVEMSRAQGDCKPPPVASYCQAQLRHVHHCILLVLPTINDLLTRSPGLDVMATYTSADRAALRELIESYQTELTYAVGAVATLALSVEKRRVVEEALLRCYRSCADAAVGPPAHQLFSFLYFKNYLVAAVGPPETYTVDSNVDVSAPLALGPDTALCGGLHVDDTLLLYRYARSLVSRQSGEAWVPVCLPRFNSTGYLWCYAVNLTHYARELRQQQGLTVWPKVWEAHAELDVLLLHVSASQDDFTALSRSTRRFTQLLYAPAVGDNFFYRLEEEFYHRTPAPLTELLSLSRVSFSTCSSYDVSGRTGGVPLWYGVVIQDSDAAFLNAAQGKYAKATTWAATAIKRTLDCPSASIRLLFESQPSPWLDLTTVEDGKEFRQLLSRYQEQLRAAPASTAAPCMLFVRHNNAIAFALIQPTPATLATLASHFFSPKNPFGVPSDGGIAGCDAEEVCHEDRGRAAAASHCGVSYSFWVDAVRALGVTELMVVFAAATPEAMAWYWVAHLLFMAVQRRGRFVVRQLIGGRR
ncbi:Trafficking protein Mon1 [Leishmania braziliensis]|nr:Trafficking protein Mon1 [Leishmania braziliensis]